MTHRVANEKISHVQMMREIRDRISAKLLTMTPEERIEWVNSAKFDRTSPAGVVKRAQVQQETDIKANSEPG